MRGRRGPDGIRERGSSHPRDRRGYDASPESARALELARQLAAALGARLTAYGSPAEELTLFSASVICS